MKRVLSMILAVVLLLTMFPQTTLFASAEEPTSGSCGENLTWSFDESSGTLTITGRGAMPDWNDFGTMPWHPFRRDTRTIVISEGVTSIGDWAFTDFSYLTSVELPTTVTSIGELAFQCCTEITSISLPDSITEIEPGAFCCCSALTSITLPDSLANIEPYVFQLCSALKSITIPSSVTSIYLSAFYDCSSLSHIHFLGNRPVLDADEIPDCMSNLTLCYLSGTTGWTDYTDFRTELWDCTVNTVCNTQTYTCNVCGEVYPPVQHVDENEDGICDVCETPMHTAECEHVWRAATDADGEDAYLAPTCKETGNYVMVCDLCGELGEEIHDIPALGHDYAWDGNVGEEGFHCVACSRCDNTDLVKCTVINGVCAVCGWSENNHTATHFEGIPASCTEEGTAAYWYCRECTEAGNGIHFGKNYTDGTLSEELTSFVVAAIGHDYVWDGNAGEEGFHGVACSHCDATDLVECTKVNGICAVCGAGRLVYSGTCGTNVTWELDAPDGILTISGTGAISNYTTSSHPGWYTYRSKIKTAVIGEGITTIGNYAFYGCTELTDITVSSSVVSIGNYAFSGCTSLTGVHLAEGLTSLGAYAFNSCSALAEIELPSTLSTLNAYAFNGTSLTAVSIPANVATMNSNPNGKTSEADYYSAFAGAAKLRTVVFEEGCTSIPARALKNCAQVTSVSLPEGVGSIGSYAFSGCTGFTGIDLPEGLTSIGNYAFNGCNGLTGIEIPDSVISVGSYAFNGCTGLRNADFGDTLPTMNVLEYNGHAYAMFKTTVSWTTAKAYCESYGGHLVTIANAEEQNFVKAMVNQAGGACWMGASDTEKEGTWKWVTGEPFSYSYWASGEPSNSDKTEHYLGMYDSGSSNKWNNVAVSSTTLTCFICEWDSTEEAANHIQLSVKQTTDDYNNKIKTIGDYAFNGCTSLTDVHLAEGLITLGAYAFNNCPALTEIELPHSLNTIKAYAFSGTSLTAVSIPANVATMDSNPNGKTSEADYYSAFAGAAKLRTVVFEEGCTSIPARALKNCAQVTSVSLPEGVGSIGSYAFSGCTGLAGIELPDSLTSIGSYAFSGCTGFTGIDLPEGLTSIGNYAFNGCNGLTGIEIPDSVTSVGTYAFNGCTGLSSISITAGKAHIASRIEAEKTNIISGNPKWASSSASGGYCVDYAYNLSFDIEVETAGKFRLIEYAAYNNRSFKLYVDEKLIGTFTATGSNSSPISSYTVAELELEAGTHTVRIKQNSGYTPIFDYFVIKPIKNASGAIVNGDTFTYYDGLASIGANAFTNAGLKDVYYTGTEEQWSTVSISSGNDPLVNATFHFGHTHFFGEWQIDIEPTCSEEGKQHRTCVDCGYSAYETINTVAHTYEDEVISPTYLAQGYTLYTCTVCGDTYRDTFTDPLPRTPLSEATLTLEYTAAYYQGTELWPAVTLEYGGEQYDATEELEVSYADNNKVGTATITVTGINKFEGTQTLSFEISYESIPEKIINVVAVGEIGKISVSWAVSAEVTTDKYNIYRKAEGEESFTKIKTVSGRNTLSYTDTAVTEGTVYEYYVTGIGLYGAESEPSQTVSAQTATDKEAPVISKFTPASETRISGTPKLAVTVSDNVGVTRVTYSTSYDRTDWTEQGSVTASPFGYDLDTTALDDGIVYVRAVAYDAAGNASAPMVRTYMVDNTPPAKVTGLATTALYSSRLTLTWEDVADVDRASYVVQKLTDGSYVDYATVSTVGCNIGGLYPDTEYTFRVACKDTCGNRGEWSEPFTVMTPADETAPVVTKLSPAPKRLNGNLDFSATAKDECGIAAIIIQTATDLTEWTDLSEKTYSTLQESRTYSYTVDMSVYAEGSVYLRAVAVDGSGNRSDESVLAPYTEYIIDRTAPAVPTGVAATGKNGYITVSWEQGTESDLGTYSVYRASSENGEYTKLASGISALNYHDRGVQTDVTYYYKVTVCDTCGNTSARSAAVGAKTSEDTEAPEILSISATSGAYISNTYHTVSVLASDNSRLDSMVVEYKTPAMAAYKELTSAVNISDYSKKVSAALPMTGLSDGDTVSVRAYAIDTAGLTSEIKTAEFTVDLSAPAADHFTAELNGTACTLSWNGCGEADLSGYKIYRSTDGGAYTSIGSRAANASGQYTFTAYISGDATHTYTFKLVPTDIRGNTSEYTAQVTYTYTEAERVNSAPKAVADVPIYMEKGVEEYFDATASTDDRMIVSYLWDFGDGTTSETAKAVKRYTESGEYTVNLTVTDDEGASATVCYIVEVKDRSELGVLNIKVVDDNNRPVPGAMVVIDQSAADARYTDGNGTVSVTLPTGDYEIGAMLDIHHLPAKKTVTVLSNATRTVTLMLVEEELVTGDFEITRMNLNDIISAGIDVYDPANQNIYQVKVRVIYGNMPLTINYIRNDTTVLSYNISDSNDKPVTVILNSNNEPRSLTPIVISLQPPEGGTAEADLVAILDVPAQASFLKEFFDVKLHITNHASRDFDLTDNEVTLNVPEGLTVMRGLTGYEGKNTVTIPKIEGQQTVTLNWCLRGETEGEYMLSADYSGNLEYFDRVISTTFNAKEPLKVYGMSGIEMSINACNTIRSGAFYFTIGLENQRPVDLYMPDISLYDKVENVTASVANNNPDGDFFVESYLLNSYVEYNGARQYLPIVYDLLGNPVPQVSTLAPGQKLVYEYVCYNAVNSDNIYAFKGAMVEVLSGIADNVTFSTYDRAEFSYVDYSEKLDAIFENQSADAPQQDVADAFRYITDNNNYYYYLQGTDTTANVFESLYTLLDTALTLDFENLTMEEQETVMKQILLGLLTDQSVIDAVETCTENKYFEAVDKILSKIKVAMISDKEAFDHLDNDPTAIGERPNYSLMSDKDFENMLKLSATDLSKLTNKLLYEGEDAFLKETATLITSRLAGFGIDIAASKFYEVYELDTLMDYSSLTKGIGFFKDSVVNLFDAVDKTLWDSYVYGCLRASANVEYSSFLLDGVIDYCDSHPLSPYAAKLREVAVDMEIVLNQRINEACARVNMLTDTFVESLEMDLAEEVLGNAIKAVLGTAYSVVSFGWKILDNVLNLGEFKKQQNSMQVHALISNALLDTFNKYQDGERTSEDDMFEYSLLASLCSLRLTGEKAYDDYFGAYMGDGMLSISEETALSILNKVKNTEYTSMDEWRNAVRYNILTARDILFNVELIDNPDTPAAPTVRLDYETNRTAERFSAEYEYCFSDGVWIRCTGDPIAFTPQRTQTVLRVRKAASETGLAGNTTTVYIYAQKELSKLITVKYDGCTYFIDNLTAGRSYQMILLNDAEEDYRWDEAITFTAAEGQTTVSPASGSACVVLRSCVDATYRETYSVPLLRSVATRSELPLTVTGNGSVAQSRLDGCYFDGETVSLTAVPNPGQELEGWYVDGVKVGSDAVYLFETGTAETIEARFTGAKPDRMVITSLPDKLIYTDGEALDMTGFVLKVYYSDGYEAVIENYTASIDRIRTKRSANASGAQIVVRYADLSVIIPITMIHGDGIWRTTAAATCTGEGTRCLYCENCGELLRTEAVSPTGHLYEDGACIYCGEPEPIYNETLKIKGATLSLRSDIGIYFMVQDSVLEQLEDPYMVFTKALYDEAGEICGTKTSAVFEYAPTTVMDGVDGYEFYFNGINAAEMGSNITATLCGKKNGVPYKGKTVDYSVLTYANNLLRKSSDTKLHSLLVDMLNYGAAAQTYAGYNTENLVNNGLTAEQRALGTAGDPAPATCKELIHNEGASVLITGCCLVLHEKVSMRYSLDLSEYAGDVRDLYAAVSYTDTDGVKKTVTIDSSDFGYQQNANGTYRYEVSFDALNAAQMRTKCTIEIFSKLTGERISDTAIYSIESYVNSMLHSEDIALAELVSAMMKYGNTTENYFLG